MRVKTKWIVSAVAGAAMALAAAPRAASGGGIEIPMQSARAAAQADAFTAQADDPSAVFYNPAGLTQVNGNQISVGAVGLFPEWKFHSDAGEGESMRMPSLLPHVYASTDLGTERLRLGIGVTNVFGLNEDWGGTGPLRTLVDEARLFVMNVSPALAYKVDDHLSLGVALDVYYSELFLNRKAILGPPPTPVGDFHIRGHDFAVGVTPSFLYKIDARNQIGGFYRSPFQLNLRGSSQVTAPGIPEIGPSHSVAGLDLPQQAGLGYAVRPIDKLKLEADVIWTDWHTLEQLRINSPDPRFNGQTIPADWRSGFTYRLGAQYDLTPNWALRAGYAYSQNAIPSQTFTPLVPDSNYHLFAAGVGYSADRWALDLAYEFIYREGRNIHDNVASPVVDGKWDNIIQGVMLTFTYKM